MSTLLTSEAAKHDTNAGLTEDADNAVAVVANRQLHLMGYSAKESAGSPAVATFNIRDSLVGSTGDILIYGELAANGSETVWFGDSGIFIENGISIDHVAGTLSITLFYKVTL